MVSLKVENFYLKKSIKSLQWSNLAGFSRKDLLNVLCGCFT